MTQQAPAPDPAGDVVTTTPRPPRRVRTLLILAACVLVADVLTKTVIVAHVEGGPAVRTLGGLVYLSVYRNPGAAWSVATGMTWLLTIIATAVVLAILWLAPRLRSPGWAVGLGLVLGGALGNLMDRFFRYPGPMEGHVVDFVSVFAPDGEYFPVFNVADSGICVGGVLIVLLALLGRDYDGTSTRDPGPDTDDTAGADGDRTDGDRTDVDRTDGDHTDAAGSGVRAESGPGERKTGSRD